jgi:hypothetical protein
LHAPSADALFCPDYVNIRATIVSYLYLMIRIIKKKRCLLGILAMNSRIRIEILNIYIFLEVYYLDSKNLENNLEELFILAFSHTNKNEAQGQMVIFCIFINL